MAVKESIVKDPQIRKGVIASVVASLVVIVIIQPVLRFAWSIIMSIGPRFIQSYIDSIYVSAALGHRNDVGLMLLMFFFSITSGIAIGFSATFTRRFLHPDQSPKKLCTLHIIALWVLVVLLHGAFGMAVVVPFADLQVNTSFQQRLRVLAPKVTDLEMKELEAAWASMRNRADYVAINVRLERSAKEHGISLPEVLLK